MSPRRAIVLAAIVGPSILVAACIALILVLVVRPYLFPATKDIDALGREIVGRDGFHVVSVLGPPSYMLEKNDGDEWHYTDESIVEPYRYDGLFGRFIYPGPGWYILVVSFEPSGLVREVRLTD